MMEVLTTSIQDLTERLAYQSERQAVLLAALREFRASSTSDLAPSEVRASDIGVDDGLRAMPPNADPVDGIDELEDLWRLPRSCEPPTATKDEATAVCESYDTSLLDRDAECPSGAASPAFVEVEPATLSVDASATSPSVESIGTTTIEAGRERADTISVARALPVDASATSASAESIGTTTIEAGRERADRTAVTRALPTSKSNGRSSAASSRRRRDYNYFADLEAKLSKLAEGDGATRT